ncbi:hypothetical protein [Micromonospora marina]|uniref:hypothetical protein n=1 Tax=Micromonospora marina TaxID=307120 RepID=UPI003D727724
MSVSLVQAGASRAITYTSPLARSLDEWQYEHDDGPCLDASVSAVSISLPDLAGVVGAYAAVVADLRAVAAVAAQGAAVFAGFLAHRYGRLTGPGDARSQAVPIGFAAVLGAG